MGVPYDGMHLGRHSEIIIQVDKFIHGYIMRHSALLVHLSTEFLVVLLVQACRITVFVEVTLQSTTSLCTSSIDAPPLAITCVFLPLRNLHQFTLLQFELLNISTSGVGSLVAGWDLLSLVRGGRVEREVAFQGSLDSCVGQKEQ